MFISRVASGEVPRPLYDPHRWAGQLARAGAPPHPCNNVLNTTEYMNSKFELSKVLSSLVMGTLFFGEPTSPKEIESSAFA